MKAKIFEKGTKPLWTFCVLLKSHICTSNSILSLSGGISFFGLSKEMKYVLGV